MIWALARERDLTVAGVHAVVDERAARYLESDVLAPGRALDQLRAVLGPGIAGREGFVIHKVSDLEMDSRSPDDLGAYVPHLWSAARQAIESAGNRPVIFGLVAGRPPAVPALVASIYQLLARKQDVLLEVTVADRRIEEQSAFFFPEQPEEIVRRGASRIPARNVQVKLIELAVPRLGGLAGEAALGSWESAMHASQVAIDASRPPRLFVDLLAGRIAADGRVLPLSAAELAWYGYLAVRRKQSAEDGWVIAGRDGHGQFKEFLQTVERAPWMSGLRTKPLQALLRGEWVDDEDLRNLRGKTVQKVKRWCAEERPAVSRWLVPEIDGRHRQRLRIDPALVFIHHTGG